MEWKLLISDDEVKMLADIGKIGRYEYHEFDFLANTYHTMKIQGSAFKIDVSRFMSLGIPIYHALAKVKKVEVSDIVHIFATASVPFEDIKQAFINLTSEGGLYYNPKI